MSEAVDNVSLLARREIEAKIVVPLLRAFIAEFGEQKTLKIAEQVIRGQAEEMGQAMAEQVGGNGLRDLQKGLAAFSSGGELETESLAADETKVAFNVTRCKYAEMYEQQGMQEFGALLSCSRDESLFEGFNSEISFTRTRTIMAGDSICDFCMQTKGKD